MPVAAWMLSIFMLSSLPARVLPETRIPHIDKVVHALEYLILQVFLIRAILGTFPKNVLAKTVISAIIISLLYAMTDEWHQGFVPGRECDVYDLLSDIIGSGMGTLIYRMRGWEWLT